MSKRYCVYMYTNLINSKMYVGITSTSLRDRAGSNGGLYRGSPFFYAAIVKHGWESFKGMVLYRKLSKEKAAVLEKSVIEKYDTLNPERGYNLHRGGFETRFIDVANRPGRIERIKQTLIKQRADPAVRAEMRARMKAQWADPVKRERRLALRLINPPGKPSTRIECLETGEVFENLRIAQERTGIHKSSISVKLKGAKDFILFKPKTVGKRLCVHLRRCV